MKAIYQVIENGHTSYFRSGIAGGYSYPFFIFEYVRRMAWQLNSSDLLGKFNFTELFPLLKANKDFPEVYLGKCLFEPISALAFADYESGMTSDDGIPFNITLDFDERTIGFVFNKNCPHLIKPKITVYVGITDARETFGKINPLFKDIESIFETDLRSAIEERPVFSVYIDSDTIPAQGKVLLPMSDHNRKGLMEELETLVLEPDELALGVVGGVVCIIESSLLLGEFVSDEEFGSTVVPSLDGSIVGLLSDLTVFKISLDESEV